MNLLFVLLILLKGSQTGFALSCVQAFVCAVPSAKKSVPPSLRSEGLTGSRINALTCQSLLMFLSSLPDFKICMLPTLLYAAPNIRLNT